MLYKNISDSSLGGVIKDVDVKTGTVTGYFSIFGNVDSDGDMIMPGAFKRSLTHDTQRFKHLYQHNFLQPLSGVRNGNLIVKEDTKGLYFESKITETSYGKDVILLYESGALDEHSIGYEVKKSNKASGYNELLELKLWEGSTVTWGANEKALVEGIKSMSKEETLSKMALFEKELRNGKYETDEVIELLTIYCKQLEQHIIELSASSTQPADTAPDSQKLVKSDDLSEDEAVLIYLKLKSITSKQQVQNETQLFRMAAS